MKYKNNEKQLMSEADEEEDKKGEVEDINDDSDNDFDDKATVAEVSTADNGHSHEGDKILFRADCKIVVLSANSSQGVLTVTKSKISFVRAADLGNDVNKHSSKRELHDCQPFLSTQWSTRDVCDVMLRYYNLRFVAVEIFFTSRTTVFVDMFDSDTAQHFENVIRRRVKPPFFAPFFGRKPATIILNATSPHSTQTITSAWANREISNFEYLMRLNTIAGRTFNDLGQYPIFPWIIADYVSSELNLRDPNTFRDLRYPMGAQNLDQRQLVASKYRDLLQAYKEMEGDEGAMPPFHFGSHYSVAGFVLWYLMRVEPYTSLHIQLQDGRFDKADRMFGSIAAAWKGCTTNTSDVKELVPELFYCPEFLL